MQLFLTSRERDALARCDDAPSRLALAWALRQSEPARSAALFDACDSAALPTLATWRTLADAEAAALDEDLPRAAALLEYARHAFRCAGDTAGAAMCAWVEVQIAWAGGEEARLQTLLRQLIQDFEAAGDTASAQTARLELAGRIFARDRAASLAELAAVDPQASGVQRATFHVVEGITRAQVGQHAQAIRSLLQALEHLEDCGMRYRAVACCTLLAFNFSALGDATEAIEWAQRGLAQSPPSWVLRTSTCRLELAHALQRRQQPADARRILEALVTELRPRPHSRVMHQARCHLAQLDAAQGQWEAATGHFEVLLVTSRLTGFADLEADALQGLAGCAMSQGDFTRARELVQAGLALAQQQQFSRHIRDLLLRAAEIEIEAGEAAQALALLARADAVSAPIDGTAGSPATQRLAARAHEQLAQWQQALACTRRVAEAEQAELTRAWEQRLRAHKTLEELEHMRQQNETLRQQNAAAAERAAAAEHSLQTLERLAVVGMGLTARLSRDELFPLVDKALRNLLPVDVVMLFQRRGEQLQLLYGRADEELLTLPDIALDDPHAQSARCAREDRLLSLEGQHAASHIAGTTPTHSMLFAPLRWQGRVVGVLSLQAQAADAYGPREQQLVLSLAAYMAIALQNAHAYEQVAALQHELAERRRQAALGSLVAGVAHELNTPLGNGLLTVGTLQAQLDELQAQLQSGAPRRSQLLASANDLGAGLQLIEQGLQRAARLVRNFKELASDPASEPPEPVEVPALCRQLLTSERSALATAGLQVHAELAPAPALNSRPHTLLEVLRSLLENVLVHANATELRVCGARDGATYRIDWQDNGRGIQLDPPSRVFDPFVSTRFGQGGSGLGLSVALHRTRALLGGDLTVENLPGGGARFRLTLPLAAPALPGA